MKSADRFLIIIVVGIVLIVVIAFAVVLLRPEAEYQVGDTPEGVVHNYLLALEREDFERAYTYLSPSMEGYPTTTDRFIENIDDNAWRFRSGKNASLSVESARISSGRADVTVREISFYQGDIFESGQQIRTFTMKLRQEGDGWKIIDGAAYFASCWTFDQGCR